MSGISRVRLLGVGCMPLLGDSGLAWCSLHGLLDKCISHHHFVVPFVARLDEDLSEDFEVVFDHRIVDRDVEVVVGIMRTIMHP